MTRPPTENIYFYYVACNKSGIIKKMQIKNLAPVK